MVDNGAKFTTTIKNYSLFFSVMVVETLVIVPCIVFTTINLVAFDADTYKEYHPDFSEIIKFQFLTPILAVQVLWILTNVLSTLTTHMTIPYLFIPNIVIVMISFVVCLVIIGPSVEFVLQSKIAWTVTAFFVGLIIFVIALLAFITIRIATFRKLVKKKKTVQGTAEKPTAIQAEAQPIPPAPPSIPEIDEVSTSFSRRSTMSINDDRYEIPPKM